MSLGILIIISILFTSIVLLFWVCICQGKEIENLQEISILQSEWNDSIEDEVKK